MPNEEEIFEKVQATLVDALGVDEDEVTPQASLIRDLGAESIDFLDIVFRLEKSFEIKIPRGDLFPENIQTDPEFVQDGQVTPKGLEELRQRMPHADIDKFAANPNIQDIGDLFTVEMITRYVKNKLSGGADTA
jgi:acyl carrier protein